MLWPRRRRWSGWGRASSTRTQCLAVADFDAAEQLWVDPSSSPGGVLHGQKLGRQLDAAANIALHRIRSPLHGVYAVCVWGGGLKAAPGVANVGVKPTIGESLEQRKVHVLEGSPDLYGERLTVGFTQVRDGQKFVARCAESGYRGGQGQCHGMACGTRIRYERLQIHAEFAPDRLSDEGQSGAARAERLKAWAEMDLYGQMREAGRSTDLYPP